MICVHKSTQWTSFSFRWWGCHVMSVLQCTNIDRADKCNDMNWTFSKHGLSSHCNCVNVAAVVDRIVVLSPVDMLGMLMEMKRRFYHVSWTIILVIYSNGTAMKRFYLSQESKKWGLPSPPRWLLITNYKQLLITNYKQLLITNNY